MVKVSVIVPVYNGEKYLRECLNSIVHQSLKDIEIICVNDGSTDGSLEILEEYKDFDKRIQLYSQPNLYAGAARNLGKLHATGEYLVFWDCDDFFNHKALEKLYHRAKSTNADVCVCAGNHYLESDKKLYPHPACLVVSRVPLDGTFNRYTNSNHYLSFTNEAAWDKIFKREFIEKNNIDFQAIRNGNDVYFTMNALGLADRISVLNERLVNYRIKDDGLVYSLSKSPTAPMQAWIDVRENLEKHDGFGERSFVNKATGSIVYLLSNIQEWSAFEKSVNFLKEEGLEKLNFIPREKGYYYNEWNNQCIAHLIEDNPAEFAVFLKHSIYVQKTEVSSKYSELKRKIKIDFVRESRLFRTVKEILKSPNKVKNGG